jgi:hypothetical protein
MDQIRIKAGDARLLWRRWGASHNVKEARASNLATGGGQRPAAFRQPASGVSAAARAH